MLAGQMRIEPWDPTDETTALGCYEVHRAAELADEPMEPPMSAGTFGVFLRQGFEKTPGETWVASDADGGIVGFYRMHLWDLENVDRASIGPVIHPAVRRRGFGRAMLRHEAARAAANGRSVLNGVVVTGSAGAAFARALGAKLELEDVRRVQYLDEDARRRWSGHCGRRPRGRRPGTRWSTGPAPSRRSSSSRRGERHERVRGRAPGRGRRGGGLGRGTGPRALRPPGTRRAAARLRRRGAAGRDRGDGRLHRGGRRSRGSALGFPATAPR